MSPGRMLELRTVKEVKNKAKTIRGFPRYKLIVNSKKRYQMCRKRSRCPLPNWWTHSERVEFLAAHSCHLESLKKIKRAGNCFSFCCQTPCQTLLRPSPKVRSPTTRRSLAPQPPALQRPPAKPAVTKGNAWQP